MCIGLDPDPKKIPEPFSKMPDQIFHFLDEVIEATSEYALALKPLGFLLPTAVASAILSFQILPKFLGATVTGIGLSSCLFLIFKFGLGLSLFPLPRIIFG